MLGGRLRGRIQIFAARTTRGGSWISIHTVQFLHSTQYFTTLHWFYPLEIALKSRFRNQFEINSYKKNAVIKRN